LWTVLVAVIVVQVIARYAFGKGSIMMEELQWHLYAIGFMLGLSLHRGAGAQCAHRRAGRALQRSARGCGSKLVASADAACRSALFVHLVRAAVLLVIVQLNETLGVTRWPALPLVPQVVHRHRLCPARPGGAEGA
jgi:TRAP-type C4-dicarboxylate transport system permease small subunit